MINGATVNVLDYGADSTGTTNSTSAFDAAIATGKSVYVPKGTYKINLVLSTTGVRIFGEGTGVTILSPYTASNPVITINGDIAGTVIQYFDFSNFSIVGNARAGDGIKIINTADTHGCDRISMSNVDTLSCAYGFNCAGRSIWNYFENCAWDVNTDGVHIETDQAINSWLFNECFTRRNNRHGFYAYKTDISVSGMIGFTFVNFNSEYNGRDVSQPVSYGVYVNGATGWLFSNLTLENNGDTLTSEEGYGLYVTGSLGRSVIVDGCWAVNSKHPIKFDGQKKSGSINNVYSLAPLYGGTGIEITADWLNDEPKIEVGPVINGTISISYDANANFPTVTGVDYYGSAQTTLSLKNRKNVTINTTASTSNIATITGLVSGDVVFLFNFANTGTNKITLASGLMASGVAYDINADTGKQFMVLGFPANGKLVPI